MPTARQPSGEPTVIPSRRTMGGQRKARARILLIEDDRTLRQVVSELLRFEGYEVRPAASDAASRALIDQERFDLVVTDLFVPSSEDAVARVRLLQAAVGETPVVVMTGTWMGRELTAEQLGVARLFFKPFDVEPFLDQIRQLLRDRPLPTEGGRSKSRVNSERDARHLR